MLITGNRHQFAQRFFVVDFAYLRTLCKTLKIRIFAIVKKLTAIFLTGVYLMAFSECHQFLKIPFLIKHFQKHQQADFSMGFGRFIKIHYLSAAVITDDFQQDEKLPFRGMECDTTNTTHYTYAPVGIYINPPQQLLKKFYSYNDTHKIQHSFFDIFQPPRHHC